MEFELKFNMQATIDMTIASPLPTNFTFLVDGQGRQLLHYTRDIKKLLNGFAITPVEVQFIQHLAKLFYYS